MADRKITDLTALAAGSQATGDLLTIVDVSEAAATDKNKKITVENLLKGIPSNVGIGTSSPQDALHIAVPSAVLRLEDTDTNHISTIQSTAAGLVLTADANNTVASSFLALSVDGSEKARIDSSGNVGIGDSAPDFDLVIKGGGNTNENLFACKDSDGTKMVSVEQDSSGHGRLLVFDTSGNNDVLLHSNGNSFFNGGNVGIGTSAPTTSLHIQGANTTGKGQLIVSSASAGQEARMTFIDGSDDIAEISTDGDNLYFYNERSSGAFQFYTGGSERARIDSSGRLLQGKSATKGSTGENIPTYCTETAGNNPNVLEIANNGTGSGSYSALVLSRSDSTSVNGHTAVDSGDKIGEVAFIGADGSDRFNTGAAIAAIAQSDFSANNCPTHLTFSTNGGSATASERMRIDGSGRLLVGTTSSDSEAKLVIQGQISNSAVGAFLNIQRGEGASSITSGEGIGNIAFTDNANKQFASINVQADGTAGTNDYPGRILFQTTADGASSSTERMRIDSSGSLTVGQTFSGFGGASATARFESISAASANYAYQQVIVVHNKGTSGTRYMMSFGDSATYAERGFITWNGSNMALVNASDQRLKTNISNASSTIESVKQIQVRSFDWLENNQHVDLGFVAQELNQVAPEAVNAGIDDEDGNIDKPWTVGNASLVPRLTKALQEAIAKIETLEASNADLLARVAALEAG